MVPGGVAGILRAVATADQHVDGQQVGSEVDPALTVWDGSQVVTWVVTSPQIAVSEVANPLWERP